jgi:hypothetical protein
VKLIEGRFAWLMSSSKLQYCLELCQFAHVFLKPELQNRKRMPYQISKGISFMTFLEQDGVLLEIRNQNEESSVWSLVATTSLNLTNMSLPQCQISMDISITMFIPSPFVMA